MSTDYSIKNASVKAKLTDDAGALVEFADDIDIAQLVTSFDTLERKPVSGNNTSQVGPIKDNITVTFADSLAPGEFWLFLRENHGKRVDVEFAPKTEGGAKITHTVIATAPGTFGGAQGYNAATAILLGEGAATITPET
jgi:hypothetical protein